MVACGDADAYYLLVIKGGYLYHQWGEKVAQR